MSLPKTILSGTAVLAVVSFLVGGSITLAYVKKQAQDLPDIGKIGQWQPKEGSRILADDGTIMGVHAKEYREFVSLEDIPPTVIAAFLSAEDGNYWTHKGVDPVGVVRAFLSNIRGDRLSGGSTIPQQVVKNLLLSPERTMERKVKEALLALKIVKEIGKDRILEIYLNEIYLGAGAYGVKAAANRYFEKPLEALTPGEAAVLAGLPQAPSTSNPFANSQKATERRNYVLDRMAKLGYLTPDEATKFRQQPIVTAAKGGSEPVSGVTDPAFGYAEEAIRRLQVAEVGSDRFYAEGGDLKTTIKADLQKVVHEELRRGLAVEDRKAGWRGVLSRGISFPIDWNDERLKAPAGAENWTVGVVSEAGRDAVVETSRGTVHIAGTTLAWAVRSRKASVLLKVGDAVLIGDIGNGPELVQIPEVQGAVVVMEPNSGAVIAMDGGFSPEQSEFNRATQAKRQPGSVFKPFVYLTALSMGYDAMSPVLDSPIELDSGDGAPLWRPQEGENGLGLITLRQALERSRNHATVRLLYDIGEDRVREIAVRMGLEMPIKASYAMALGTVEMTPLSIAAAYSAIANGGRPVRPRFYGEPAPVAGAFDPIAVSQLSSMLEGVAYAGTASRAFADFKHPIAAKTGTTNGSRDVWFAAYGPKYVIVSWIGRDDFKPLHRGAAGGETVAPLVRRILDRSAGMIEFANFTLPPGATTVTADRATGKVDPDGDVVEIIREGEDNYVATEQPDTVIEQDTGEAVQSNPDEGTSAQDTGFEQPE